jgi:NitT/TauT family transport system ATP-binding protein
MIEGKGLSFSYADELPVIAGVDISVRKSEIVALLGASGCGKSTLLRLIAGLLEPNSGSVVAEVEVRKGFVFQEPSLMPWASVFENVALPMRLEGVQAGKAVNEALRAVDLEDFTDRQPSALSGGQKMRVSIARALAASPDLILLDEPFAALDEILRFQMNELLLEIKEQRDLACIFVTHSIYEAAYLADRVLVMKNGVIAGQVVPGLDRSMSPNEQRNCPAFFGSAQQVTALLEGQ